MLCYDHQYVTLQDAAKECMVHLKQQVHQCRCKMKRCQLAIDKLVEESLPNSIKTTEDTIGDIQNEYISMLDETFTRFQSSIDGIEQQRLGKLHVIEEHLVNDLDKIQMIRQLAKKTMSGSNFDVASQYTALSNQLADICNSDHSAADKTLKELKIQLPYVTFQGKPSWKPTELFVRASGVDHIQDAILHPDGDIGIISSNEFHILSKNGDLTRKIALPQIKGITILPAGKYVLYNNIQLSLYTNTGGWFSNIFLLDDKQMPMVVSKPVMTSDLQGRIIAGSRSVIYRSRKPYISVHNKDGSFLSGFNPSSSPEHLATTPNEDIVILFADNTVQLVNYAGGNIRNIPAPPQAQQWAPRDVYCGASELFIVSVGEPSGVFFYTISGIYLGHMHVKDLKMPCGIGLSSDQNELLVWNGMDNGDMRIDTFKQQ